MGLETPFLNTLQGGHQAHLRAPKASDVQPSVTCLHNRKKARSGQALAHRLFKIPVITCLTPLAETAEHHRPTCNHLAVADIHRGRWGRCRAQNGLGSKLAVPCGAAQGPWPTLHRHMAQPHNVLAGGPQPPPRAAQIQQTCHPCKEGLAARLATATATHPPQSTQLGSS